MPFCFIFVLIYRQKDAPPVTFSPRTLVILRHWVSVGVRRWGGVEGYVKKNEFSLKKQRKANLLSLDKRVCKIMSAKKRATFAQQNKEQKPKSQE